MGVLFKRYYLLGFLRFPNFFSTHHCTVLQYWYKKENNCYFYTISIARHAHCFTNATRIEEGTKICSKEAIVCKIFLLQIGTIKLLSDEVLQRLADINFSDKSLDGLESDEDDEFEYKGFHRSEYNE